MKLLIDADFIVYKSCAACETEVDYGDDVIVVTSKFSDAYNMVKRELKKITEKPILWITLRKSVSQFKKAVKVKAIMM